LIAVERTRVAGLEARRDQIDRMADELRLALVAFRELGEPMLREINEAPDVIELDRLRVKYLRRTGLVSKLSEGMKDLPKEGRPRMGKLLNELRTILNSAFETKNDFFSARADISAVQDLDETLPATPLLIGALHPLTRLQDRAVQILRRLGFALATGPESRPNGIVSTRPARLLITPLETKATLSIFPTATYCERIPRPFKSGRCSHRRRRFESLPRAPLIDETRSTPRI
jgi:hypothetical protein